MTVWLALGSDRPGPGPPAASRIRGGSTVPSLTVAVAAAVTARSHGDCRPWRSR